MEAGARGLSGHRQRGQGGSGRDYREPEVRLLIQEGCRTIQSRRKRLKGEKANGFDGWEVSVGFGNGVSAEWVRMYIGFQKMEGKILEVASVFSLKPLAKEGRKQAGLWPMK